MLEFIQTQIKTQPVLLFCHHADMDLLKTNKLKFTRIDTFEDWQSLRKLDKPTDDGTFMLLVATHSHTMRGTDFRANTTGMTMIVAKSFRSEREA